jgi:hypothetical protein
MGSRIVEPPIDLEFVDTGNAPEFFVEGIGKQELLEGGNVRTYVCSRRGKLLVVQYTSVVSIMKLAIMARQCLQLCGEAHNELVLKDHRGMN